MTADTREAEKRKFRNPGPAHCSEPVFARLPVVTDGDPPESPPEPFAPESEDDDGAVPASLFFAESAESPPDAFAPDAATGSFPASAAALSLYSWLRWSVM